MNTNKSIFQGVNIEPFVELSFPVRGITLPADHGYRMYAALVRKIPPLHEDREVSISTISGIRDKQGKICLSGRSVLLMRVPVGKIPMVYCLAGQKIQVGLHEIILGIPKTSMLQPVSQLRARVVTIKGYTQPEDFQAAAQRQLEKLGIYGELQLFPSAEGSRKTIKIQSRWIVGFTLVVSRLSRDDSIKLQQWGIGGKRHMGCGVFLPWRSG